jgi:hypothetical protein
MQISKSLLLCLAIAAPCCLPSAARAADAEPENIVKAREALRQKMTELTAEQSAGLSDALPSDTEDLAKARRALRQKLYETQVAYGFGPVTVPVQLPPRDSDEAYKTREALRQKMEGSAAATTQPTQTVRRAAPGPAPFTPLPRVESPYGPDKQQKLQELLRRYQADELTPEQYHQERAKLLAAP